MESSAFIPFSSSSCKARIGTRQWKMIHEMPDTSLTGKNKQYNKQFKVVPIGGRRQETSLMLLSVPGAAVRSVTPVIPCIPYL